MLVGAKRARLVALGLDGLPMSLALRLARSDITPNLGRLMERGAAHGPIMAELPELSPVNWTSFYTAAGPGEHGVFGFTRIDPSNYVIGLSDSHSVACPRVFDRLGDAGLTSKVVNLPNTYPARPIKGMLVAGFPARDLAGAAHPRFLVGPLAGAGYKLEADTLRGRENPEFLLDELREALDSRRRALDLFWPDLAWDLFVFVLTETDRLFHFLFHAVEDASQPLHWACMDFFRRWDAVIGDVLERYDALPAPKRLIALADHGFTRLRTEVDCNAALRRAGFLELSGRPADEVDASVIAPEARAFALDPGRIYIHDNERFARGRVPATARAETAEAVRAALLEIAHEGAPVLEAVHRGADLYHGPMAGAAPDLVCQALPGYDLKAKFDRDEVFGLFGRSGAHTAGDVFYCDDDHNAASRVTRVRDAGAEILRYFGLSQDNGAPSGVIVSP